ncbi:MAG: type II toxin-antitoxin system VapC family toxin [Thermoleophilaceae bacterium]
MIVAALDCSDHDHQACAKLLADARERRIIPAPVLVEADHFLTRYLGPDAFVALLADIRRGAFDVENLVRADYERVSELLRTYADLNVGFVDCAVLAIVERLAECKLATLDHRHFATLRPSHRDALELLPEQHG